MDTLVIHYDGPAPSTGLAGAGHVFYVRTFDGQQVAGVVVRLDHSGRAALGNKRVDRGVPTSLPEAIDQVLVTYAVRRLESVLMDSVGRAELLGSQGVAWELSTGDVDELASLAAERDLVLFVLKKNLPSGGGQTKGLAVLLDRWTNAHPDPYRGHHWPT